MCSSLLLDELLNFCGDCLDSVLAGSGGSCIPLQDASPNFLSRCPFSVHDLLVEATDACCVVLVEAVSCTGDVLCLSTEDFSVVAFFFAGISSESSMITTWFSDEPVPSLYPPLFCLEDEELNFLFPNKFLGE